jgi:hypothetical protein
VIALNQETPNRLWRQGRFFMGAIEMPYAGGTAPRPHDLGHNQHLGIDLYGHDLAQQCAKPTRPQHHASSRITRPLWHSTGRQARQQIGIWPKKPALGRFNIWSRRDDTACRYSA